jgi:DNA invertase Pin-like site-specific DNA recombinase
MACRDVSAAKLAEWQPEAAMKAATYVRASTELQTYSTSNQTRALQAFADQCGHEIIAGYEDDGRSGLTLAGRPGLRQLIQDALAPGRAFGVLLIYDISRWGRFQDADEGAHYEFLCRRAGLEVIYVAEPFANDGTPLATIMKAIKRTMAAEYSRELSDKVARGKRNLAERGFSMLAPGYGLRRPLVDHDGCPKGILERGQHKGLQSDHVMLVPGPPSEQAVVRRIFRLYADHGFGFQDIANFLNRQAIASNCGTPWRDDQVKMLLTNEAYIGNSVYGRTKRHLKGKTVRVPPEEWIRCEGVLPSIVPKRLFRQVQARMAGLERVRTDEYFLRPLRKLYARKGYLSAGLIDAEPGIPSPASFSWRFGGLTNAYYRVGYLSPKSELARWRRAQDTEPSYEALLFKLKELLIRESHIRNRLRRQDPSMGTALQVDDVFDEIRATYQLIEPRPKGDRRHRQRRAELPQDR